MIAATETRRILLTTVFSPYGIKDCYAEAAGMQMELLSNQITREQFIHSPRTHFSTFPLYFLAENIAVPATVLDFPRWRDFTREMKKGYTHVGISFIQTNVEKAGRMARYLRTHYPKVKIILGGYGTALPDLQELVPHDAACPGEGMRWLREYFGEDPNRPIRHPLMSGPVSNYMYGVRVEDDGNAPLFPGLGCRNGCFFCATSHKFGKQYIPIIESGKQMFELCRAAEERLGTYEFVVIDENFLADPQRAVDLLAEMEKAGKVYRFLLFSSAGIISKLGVDFLVRLGVVAAWVGIETKADVFEKLRDTDLRALLTEMQAKGISVVSSSILFMEHHDRQTMDEDIDWAIGFGTDMHQFMQLTPLPGTPLFERYRKEGRLIPGMPYRKMSGQLTLNFRHPEFEPEEIEQLTRAAFRRKYERHGPVILNVMRTALTGYERMRRDIIERRAAGLRWCNERLRYVKGAGNADDDYLMKRAAMLRQRLCKFRPLLTAARVYAPGPAIRKHCADLARRCDEVLGRANLSSRMKALGVLGAASIEALRYHVSLMQGRTEIIRQPPPMRTEYRTAIR